MLSAKRWSPRPNSGEAAASPVSITLRKSGLRPNMPHVLSIQILTMPRRRTRSSTKRGSMNESPTGWPLDGEANVIFACSAGSCCMSKSSARLRAAPAKRLSFITSPIRSPSMKICRSSRRPARNSLPVRMGMDLNPLKSPWPALSRPSTSFYSAKKDFVDDRVKPGHDNLVYVLMAPRHYRHAGDRAVRRAVDDLVADREVDQRIPLLVDDAVDVGVLEEDRGALGIDLLFVRQSGDVGRDRTDLTAGQRKARRVLGQTQAAFDVAGAGLADVAGDPRHLQVVERADANLVVCPENPERRADAGQVVGIRRHRREQTGGKRKGDTQGQ